MKPRGTDTRVIPSSTFTANFSDRCSDCYDDIEEGDEVAFLNTDLVCWACLDDAKAAREARRAQASAEDLIVIDSETPVHGDAHAQGHRNHFRLRRS